MLLISVVQIQTSSLLYMVCEYITRTLLILMVVENEGWRALFCVRIRCASIVDSIKPLQTVNVVLYYLLCESITRILPRMNAQEIGRRKAARRDGNGQVERREAAITARGERIISEIGEKTTE